MCIRDSYCTGHSMGCMMTHYLGSAKVSHRFAAMGATSGPLMAREETGSQTVPMFMTMAQYDMWSYDLNQDDTMTTQAVDMWPVSYTHLDVYKRQIVGGKNSTRDIAVRSGGCAGAGEREDARGTPPFRSLDTNKSAPHAHRHKRRSLAVPLSFFTQRPVSYTHLDVYKRQPWSS